MRRAQDTCSGLCFGITSTTFAQSGSIAGKVLDSETGETLIGANILIRGTTIGTTTDLDGSYTIRNVEPDSYDLVFSYIGYTSKTVTGIEFKAGDTATVDLTLAPESVGLDEVIVEARALQNTEAAKSGESTARYQSGSFPRDLSSEAVYETRTLQYVARELDSYQARGQHVLFGDRGLNLEWSGTLSNTIQDEPDLRFFTNNYTPLERNGTIDTVYTIRPSIYPVPTRYFRRLDEQTRIASAGAVLPFRRWSDRSA